jgi:hypothetical protein
MNETFTLRVPSGWTSRLDSARIQDWLADFIHSPRPLPDDPGPGDDRLSLSLQKRRVNVLAAMLDVNPSVALRRLAAHHMSGYGAPPVALQGATSEAIPPARPSRPSAEFRPATLISSAPLVRQELVPQELAVAAVASQTHKVVKRFSAWRLGAVVALLVLLPIIFLYLSHVLGDDGGGRLDSEVDPIFEPFEDYEFDALAEC